MFYILSMISGRNKRTMWTLLAIRWVAFAAIANPVITIGAILMFVSLKPLMLVIGVILHYVWVWYSPAYKRWTTIYKFRRKWPILWAQVQTNQLMDMDDGHLNRPFGTAPKLGWRYIVDGSAIILKVKPAVGKTLAALQDESAELAAQTELIGSLNVKFKRPSDRRGQLEIIMSETLEDKKVPIKSS